MEDESETSFYRNDSKSILISNTNKLLSAVGIGTKKILSMEELVRVAPSMFVAIFEALYHIRIDGVSRNPRTREDYIDNAQLVIDNLSDQINIDLTHISGELIVSGDFDALSNLVHIFMRIVSLASEQDSISTIESHSESLSSAYSDDDTEHSNVGKEEEMLQNRTHKHSNLSSKQHKLLTNAFEKVYKLRHFRQNLMDADKRRKYAIQTKTALARVNNMKKTQVTNTIKQKRFSEDQSNQRRSHELKLLHQEEKLLAKLYSRLFKEAKQLRTLQYKEDAERMLQLTKQLEMEITEIEKRFTDRMDILLSHNRQLGSSIPQYHEIIEELKGLYEKKIDSILSKNEQSLEKKLLGRKEAILSVFPGASNHEEWTNNLRSYPQTHKQTIKRTSQF